MRKKILVADDDPLIQDLLTLALQDLGFEVRCVDGGQAAIDAIGQETFCLFLIDLYMDDMSGLDVLARIRAMPEVSDAPALVVSAEDDLASMSVALEFGANDYVTKPINLESLRAKILRNLPWQPDPGEALSPGTRLGAYELLEARPGRGGGRHYRARDVRLGRTVGLVVPPEKDIIAPAGREALALSRLNHPNVLNLYDVSDGTPRFFVTEDCQGTPLEQVAESFGNRIFVDSVRLVMEILEGLEHIHTRGIVHCRLSPRNLLVTASGKVKITDFYAALVNGDCDSYRGMTDCSRDADFAAPEQVEQSFGPVGPAADLFSTAALLYYLLAGRAPFSPAQPYQQLFCIALTEPDSIQSRHHPIPPTLEEVCLHGLSKQPDRRFQSAEHFRQALRPHLSQAIRTSRSV